MSDDDRDVLARLAVLEAEAKAEVQARADRRRQLELVQAERARRAAARAATAAGGAAGGPADGAAGSPAATAPAAPPEPPPARRAEPPPARRAEPAREREDDADDDGLDPVAAAMTVARGAKLATQAKAELSRPTAAGEKSWLVSGALSTLLGPLGWLYAGSFREAIPAGAAYLLAMAIVSKLPLTFLLMPALLVALPVSGIVGVVYAVQHNRKGRRARLFGGADKPALPPAARERSRR